MKKIFTIISMILALSTSHLSAEDRRSIIAVGDFTATDESEVNYADSLRERIIRSIERSGYAKVVDLKQPDPYAALKECSEPNFEGEYILRNETERKVFFLSGDLESISVEEHRGNRDDTTHFTAKVRYSIEMAEIGGGGETRSWSLESEFVPKSAPILPSGGSLDESLFYQYSPEMAINKAFDKVVHNAQLFEIFNMEMFVPAQIKLLKSDKKYKGQICLVNLGVDNTSSHHNSYYISVYEKRSVAGKETKFHLFKLPILESIDECHVICGIEKMKLKILIKIGDADIIYIRHTKSLIIM